MLKNILYYGTNEPLPERQEIRLGPLTLVYEAGGLRTIRWGDREVIRRIYVAVRDRNWGTVPVELSNLQVERGNPGPGSSFRITFDGCNKEREIVFAWKGMITGSVGKDTQSPMKLTFSLDGEACSTFLTNRIGFSVLYPADAAGARAIVQHVDGSQEKSSLPQFIVPDQPVPPFADMQSFKYEAAPGLWVDMRFEGGVFEMEDQRNWTDASYKVFCPPLRLPYPVEMLQGSRVKQSLTLTLVPAKACSGLISAEYPKAVAESPGISTLMVGSVPAQPLPSLGLCTASHLQPVSAAEFGRLRALNLHHLRIDLHLADPLVAEKLRIAAGQAVSLGIPLEAALLLSESADAELQSFQKLLQELHPPIAAWLVYPEKELFLGGSSTAEVVRLARQYLQGFNPQAVFGAGTNTDFIFMQRTPPPLDLLDLVCLAINPQVHAFDNASMVETLAAQAVVVSSARRLAQGRPVAVSPVTLKPRHNPYATGAITLVPAGELPPQVDVRQMSLLGAGWTLGSLKYLSESGAYSLTYYETTGWRGVMETAAGSVLPEPVSERHRFHSFPGGVFPLYHVLADVGEFAGGELLPSQSNHPLQVDVLTLLKEGRRRILAANLTCEPQTMRVQAWKPGEVSAVRVRRLDETNAQAAMCSPEDFRTRSERVLTDLNGVLEFRLLPYGVVCFDE